MALSAGTRLGSYEIHGPLGAGGMGEVYRAHDTRLDRDVALKVLPDGALSDEEARKRFRREAKALSRLSHPHVATLFDFDAAEGMDFLVMELVRGPSLRDELEDKGALPEKDVIRLGSQLARGLQAAHEQGIVHRDLKPGNLQLTPDGLLKILDFGLARLLPREAAPGEETAPTQTAVGKVAGTLLYMSPEQLRGRGVDARADLYAAGAVLYEVSTGTRLFSKPSSAELTEAILNEDPTTPRDLNERISTGLEAVILKALDKDPELRYQTAKDLLVDLERLQIQLGSRVPASVAAQALQTGSPRARRVEGSKAGGRLWRWVGTLTVTIAMGAGAWLARPTPLPKITAIHPLLWESGRSVKTDGTRVYQIVTRGGRSTLQQVPISGGDPVETPLPFPGEVTLLSAIPGESSLLVAGSPEELTPEETAEGWPVWRLSLPVGVPERLGDLVAHEMDVSPDGKSLALIRGGVLVLASIDGSDPRELLRLEHGINGLRWSPDGRRLRYTSVGPRENQGRWIWEIPVAGGPPRPLWPGHWGAWTGDGEHYVFDRPPAHDLYFATESPWARWWPGPPRPLTSGRGSFRLYGGSTNGDRLIVSGGLTPRGRGTLLQYDPKRKVFEPAIGGESAFYAEPSPDGEWLAWVRPEGTLWRSRPDGSERLQLTRTPSRAFLPRWSPDGTRIVYVNKPDPSSRNEIRVVAADGSAGELIARSEFPSEEYWDACWLPDDSIIMSHLNRRGLFRYDPSSRRVAPEPGGARHWFPKCSRQGDVLAALAQGALQVRRRGTTEWRDLGVRLSYPNWTRDGRSVCGLTLQHRVVCFDLAADRATVIVDASGVGLARSGDAWMGLDAEDRPLVLADDGQAYVYALHWEAP